MPQSGNMGRLRGISTRVQIAADLQKALEAKPDDLAELALAASAGDPDAAATLVVHLGTSILRVVRKVLGRDDPDVDDVAQDSVIAFLDALVRFRGQCSVAHFAQRIALLTALGTRRRTRRRGRWSKDASEFERHHEGQHSQLQGRLDAGASESGAQSPLAMTVASRRRALVLQLLDELPDVTAEALALHFVLGYTVDEIAAAAGVPPNTVWSRLRLGKQALRRRMVSDVRLQELVTDRQSTKGPATDTVSGYVKGKGRVK